MTTTAPTVQLPVMGLCGRCDLFVVADGKGRLFAPDAFHAEQYLCDSPHGHPGPIPAVEED